MQLDVDALQQMHPLLPGVVTRQLALAASVALARQAHRSPTSLELHAGAIEVSPDPTLSWSTPPPGVGAQLDRNRVTEDGAEAVALAIAAVARGWTVRRRLQRGESADWLLVDGQGAAVAFEVSGIDGPLNRARVAAKLAQAANAEAAQVKAACVVAFQAPEAELRQ